MRVNHYGRGRGLAWHPHDPSRHAGRRELGEANHADLLRQRAAMATGRWTNEAIPEDASIGHLDGGAVHHRHQIDEAEWHSGSDLVAAPEADSCSRLS